LNVPEVKEKTIEIAGVQVSPHHYINGERVSSTKTFEVMSPIDMSVLGYVSRGGQAEIDAAVSASKKAFPAWAALGPEGRAEYLDKLAHIIEERVPDLAIVAPRDETWGAQHPLLFRIRQNT
jgi:acyl-CoA reductase-like NAD-dependent aldehyde dehydrogenase